MRDPLPPAASTRRQLFMRMTALATVVAVAGGASRSSSGPIIYTYDDFGRIVLVTNADGSQTSYSYDATDNRSQVTTTGVPTSIQVTVASNLLTLATSMGYAGGAGARYTFVVGTGAVIMGHAHGNAITTGVWPSDAVLTLIVRGTVYGGGGIGGAGSATGAGLAATNGGSGILVQSPITIILDPGSVLKAGGGGGGGGGYSVIASGTVGGDGGGGGFPNGTGGAGSAGTTGDPAGPGNDGTVTGGGLGGSNGPPGGKGGDAGAAGIAGSGSTGAGGARGGAGHAISDSGGLATLVNNGGTIVGVLT